MKDFDIQRGIRKAQLSFESWKMEDIESRVAVIRAIKSQLLNNKEYYGSLMTQDMNKPLKQAIAEVEKCGKLCDYYAERASDFLKPKILQSSWGESYVTYEPLGVLLGVMPWNFPFWQVFRFAIPSLLAGNTIVLKHASNVPECARALEVIFNQWSQGAIYVNLPVSSSRVEEVIAHRDVKAVSLTGSEGAGRSVASIAGKHLKKLLLELGGSNAFIVCEDAVLDEVVPIAVKARMQNAGQSCIAAKRFLVHESLVDEFSSQFKRALSELKAGDPMDLNTELGALAREDLAVELDVLVQESIALGAQLELGGVRDGAFYPATLLTGVTVEMPVFAQETFGPVAAVVAFRDWDHAVALSNRSDFGLGVSIFTKDLAAAKAAVPRFNEGAVFINEMVISDPAVPFGGIKNSGYGRELAQEGMLEFVNFKAVVIK